jgi:hypothetical protein
MPHSARRFISGSWPSENLSACGGFGDEGATRATRSWMPRSSSARTGGDRWSNWQPIDAPLLLSTIGTPPVRRSKRRNDVEDWVAARWDAVAGHWSRQDTATARRWVAAKYPWMSARNVQRAVNQATYYAWHG